jgi:hypothetical protein
MQLTATGFVLEFHYDFTDHFVMIRLLGSRS